MEQNEAFSYMPTKLKLRFVWIHNVSSFPGHDYRISSTRRSSKYWEIVIDIDNYLTSSLCDYTTAD